MVARGEGKVWIRGDTESSVRKARPALSCLALVDGMHRQQATLLLDSFLNVCPATPKIRDSHPFVSELNCSLPNIPFLSALELASGPVRPLESLGSRIA